jgi:hypothetical protein
MQRYSSSKTKWAFRRNGRGLKTFFRWVLFVSATQAYLCKILAHQYCTRLRVHLDWPTTAPSSRFTDILIHGSLQPLHQMITRAQRVAVSCHRKLCQWWSGTW